MMEINYYYIFIAIYMLSGLIIFEWAYQKVKPIREINEERDSQYPAYRRLDVKNWARWKFWFGAMTWMQIRLIMPMLILFLQYIYVK